MAQTYLFYTSVIGMGTIADPFISSLSDYSDKFNSNDGRGDIDKPDSYVFSMLVEAELTDFNLMLAQNDVRMTQVIPEAMPTRSTQLSDLLTLSSFMALVNALDARSFDGSLINPTMDFCDFYKVLLFEFRIKTLLGSDYFTVGIDQNISHANAIAITRKISLENLSIDFMTLDITPRHIISGMWNQRFIDKHYRFFQTHLDAPVPLSANSRCFHG